MHIILEVVHEHWGSKLAQSCAFPTRGDLKCSPVEGAVSKALRLSLTRGNKTKGPSDLTTCKAQHCFASEI